MNLERVILASDFSPRFLNFASLAGFFWNKHFGVRPDLAIVVESSNTLLLDDLRELIEPHCKTHVLRAVDGIPAGNQAKLARWFMASSLESGFSTIDDLDTVHTSPDYLLTRFSNHRSGTLLAIGREVYRGTKSEGAFPMGNLSGSSDVFQEVFAIRPGEVSFEDFVASFSTGEFNTGREDVTRKVAKFSDEHLLRKFLSLSGKADLLNHVARDLDIHNRWLDRSWWFEGEELELRLDQLESINFPRPLLENRKKIVTAIEKIEPEFLFSQLPLPYSQSEWNFRMFMKRHLPKRYKRG